MSKNYNRKFNEIAKTRISPSRNAIISSMERVVKDEDGNKKVETGYLIAQQMEVVEDGDVTRVFIKGASMKLHNLSSVIALRDALTKVIGMEAGDMAEEEKPPKSKEKCKHKDSDGKYDCNGDDEVPMKDTSGKKKKKKKKVHKEVEEQTEVEEQESIPIEEEDEPEEETEEYADDTDEETEGDIEESEEDQELEEEEEYAEEEGEDEDDSDEYEEEEEDEDQEPEEEDGEWEYEDEEEE